MRFKGIEICCPHCREDVQPSRHGDDCLACVSCGHVFPVVLGIPDMRVFPDPYIDAMSDHEKAQKLAIRLDELSFAELIGYYYSITPVVPPSHARQYTRGLLSAESRCMHLIDSWIRLAPASKSLSNATVLEIGCGSAPFLVAAASRFEKLVGVDIAFRWLVVAKKRLAEAGVEIPLICACAEALPFPSDRFDWLVADSVIENVTDQAAAMSEAHRVMRDGGQLFVATPNRFSLGPDPHAGIWAGAYIPASWLAAYVRRQGGIPPKRTLLSVRSLSRLITESGFAAPRVYLPDVSVAQQNDLGIIPKTLVTMYQFAKRIPVSRHALYQVGPLLNAVAEKTNVQIRASRTIASES